MYCLINSCLKRWGKNFKFIIATNVPTLGEGDVFNHKSRCGGQMLNIAVNVERSTAPPLLPSVCYTLARLIKRKLKLKHETKFLLK